MIGFTSLDFMPIYGIQFYLTYTFNKFLYLKENITASLLDNQLLGPHTDLIVMEYAYDSQKCIGKKFRWSHPGIKPFGVALNHQCQECKALRSWKPSDISPEKISIKCSGQHCKVVQTFVKGEELQYCGLNKSRYTNNQGEWMYEII
jgi:hypothetical protein